jgi:cytochrome c oxidase subunit 1
MADGTPMTIVDIMKAVPSSGCMPLWNMWWPHTTHDRNAIAIIENAIAFVSMFVIGGLSGIYMASTPVDIFIHDTYYIVAHIHYVVFGGSIFGAFAAIYYWFPKMYGRMMNETLGKIHFWLSFIFFNGTFFPMHIIGVGGHMRRIYNPTQYDFLKPLQHWNVFITVCALCLGASQILLIVNYFWSMFAGRVASKNPWNANTLEWEAPTPPPHGNFPGELPTVYRGPYEYSSPEVSEDFLPQARRLERRTAAAH